MSEQVEQPQAPPDSASEPSWPLHDVLVQLRASSSEAVVGIPRMGAGLAFHEAGGYVEEIAGILSELRLDWDRLGPVRQAEIAGQANAVISAVSGMLKMDSSHVDTANPGTISSADEVRNHRDALYQELTNLRNWFVEKVRPLCVIAPARQAAEDFMRTESASLSPQQVQDLKDTFLQLKEDAREFERLRPVVEAQRELLGASGTAKLSADFEAEAAEHGRSWKKWLCWLLSWIGVAGIGGVVFIVLTKPSDDATKAQIVSHLFLSLLVIGLALFVVRILALQFRAHRHMEVVARNKASALSTFNRVIVDQEPEVKTVVAAALAQAVFKVDEGVFGDSSSEHVTILERVLSPGIDRLRP